MAQQPEYSPRTVAAIAAITRNLRKARHPLPEDVPPAPPSKRQRADPESDYGVVENLRFGNTIISARRQREWLHRSKQWPGLPSTEWRPRRVLGAGAYAICGLWEYIGLQPSPGNMPRQVVVKQYAKFPENLRLESKFMRAIQDSCDTEHIVKLYRSYHRERGSGTSKADPWPSKPYHGYDRTREVAKIYLEYCKGGDLENTMRKSAGVLPEELVWRTLECLANAMVVLEHGTEDIKGATWDKPIAHFDIKPSNIMIHSHNATHPRLEVFKLADFGLALQVPRDVADETWISVAKWRGTPQWLSPEQGYSGMIYQGSTLGKRDRISTPTNIWALGAVMYYIMTGGRFVQSYRRDPNSNVFSMRQDSFMTRTPLIPEMGGGKDTFATSGHELRHLPYSKYLVELVFACLAHNPNNRLRAREVLKHVREALNTYDRINMENGDNNQVSFGEADLENVRPSGLPGFTRDEISKAESEGFVSLPWAPAPSVSKPDYWVVSPEIGTKNLAFRANLTLGPKDQVWNRELEPTPEPFSAPQVEETTPREPGVAPRKRKTRFAGPLPPPTVEAITPKEPGVTERKRKPSGFQGPRAPSWSPITAVAPNQQPLRPPGFDSLRAPSFSPITSIVPPQRNIPPPRAPSFSPITPIVPPQRSIPPPRAPIQPPIIPQQPVQPVQPAVPPPVPLPQAVGRPLRRNPDRAVRHRLPAPPPPVPPPAPLRPRARRQRAARSAPPQPRAPRQQASRSAPSRPRAPRQRGPGRAGRAGRAATQPAAPAPPPRRRAARQRASNLRRGAPR